MFKISEVNVEDLEVVFANLKSANTVVFFAEHITIEHLHAPSATGGGATVKYRT